MRNLQDFVGPYDFLNPSAPVYTITVPTLTCSNTTGTISVQNNNGSYLAWSTSDGNITSSSTDSIQINKSGTYTIEASIAQGCPVIRTDVVTVAIDSFPPVASFSGTVDLNQLTLHGGDTVASNYNTPFGGSQGLLWNWSGPNGFTATIQNPVTNNLSGNFQLIVTEIRNGCTDTVSNIISFAILSSDKAPKVKKATEQSYVLAGTNFSTSPRLIVNTKETIITKVMVYNSVGQIVYAKQVVLLAGKNNIELPISGRKNGFHIVSLFFNNRVQFSGKVIF